MTLIPPGAAITWGPNEQHTRAHAYPDRCHRCPTPAHHRRTHKPAAICGKAWGRGWPVTDEPRLLRCRDCQRILIGGPP